MIKFKARLTGVCFSMLLCWTAPASIADEAFGYTHEFDVVYGQGKVAPNGQIASRDLVLDVYLPSEGTVDPGPDARPAVVLVHGGAHLRGGRRQAPYKENGAVHSRMEDYARLLAPLGYVAFVIEYRLAPETPIAATSLDAFGLISVEEAVTDSGLARMNFAMGQMGLPPIAPDEKKMVWDAAMAGAEDTAKAVEFIRANADRWNIDPDRIAVGGHSAGGGNALNASFGLKAPVAAIFPMSPPTMLYDAAQVVSGPDLPPTLLIVSSYDIDSALEVAPELIPLFKASDVDYQFAWVPGFPHFYPSGAITLGNDGTRLSVGERIIAFLDKHLKG